MPRVHGIYRDCTLTNSATATTGPQLPPTAAFICDLERARTQSLVGKNFALARRLHAPEYQRITPGGKTVDGESD